jgi:glycine oxidase
LIPNIFIIGGGVMGLSAGLALARRGMSVTLADEGSRQGTSSWAGAGILSPLPPWAYPDEVSRLAQAGMRAWPDWAGLLESQSRTSPEFWTCGMEVRLAAGQDAAMAWCQARGIPAERVREGLWLPAVSQVRNPRLLASLAEAFVASGGRLLRECEVTDLTTAEDRITCAQTTQGNQHADQFVLATGAWAGSALGPLAPVPSLRPIRGQMLLYAPGSHRLAHVLLEDGFYLVPRKDGHLLAGSTLEDAGFDAATTPAALAGLHERACGMLPDLKRHAPMKQWAGLRPGSPDNLPVIDRHADFANLWVHAGHFRYGVTMAPASSELLAQLIMGETPLLDPAPYSWLAILERRWPASP